jgi:predicted small lipoprotein YifL
MRNKILVTLFCLLAVSSALTGCSEKQPASTQSDKAKFQGTKVATPAEKAAIEAQEKASFEGTNKRLAGASKN